MNSGNNMTAFLINDDSPDEELTDLMEDYDLDEETADRVREIMDDTGVDEDDAVEFEGLM